MREVRTFVFLMMTATVMASQDRDKRDASPQLEEYLKPPRPPLRQTGRSMTKYSDAEIVIVNPPKAVAERINKMQRRDDMSRITMIPTKPLHGYLQLKPVSSDWLGLHSPNEGIAENYRNIYSKEQKQEQQEPPQRRQQQEKQQEPNQRRQQQQQEFQQRRQQPDAQRRQNHHQQQQQQTTPFARYHQERVINLTTPRTPHREMSLGQRLARWFFSGGSEGEEDNHVAGSSPKQNLVRPPPNYEKFPPYWQDGKRHKNAAKGHYKIQQQQQQQQHHGNKHEQPQKQQHYAKKECSECNSVPWIPMNKNNGGGGGDSSLSLTAPLEHHDSNGVYSVPSVAVLPPAPVDSHPVATISSSFGLPAGNLPSGHGLLPPAPSVNVVPIIHQPIPFPELSTLPLAPIYDAKNFASDDTRDLVPPLPPKSIGNVIFTIHEHIPEPQPDQYLQQFHQQQQQLHQQHQQQQQQLQHQQQQQLQQHHQQQQHQQQQHHHQQQNSQEIQQNLISSDQQQAGSIVDAQPSRHSDNSVVDIVKSVPLAEYTSSIQYPIQIVQSSPIIDVSPVNYTRQQTYEKLSQTGDKKISDIILGYDNKKDSVAEGSSYSETTNRAETTKQGKSDSIFSTPNIQQFQNSFRQENGQLLLNNVVQASLTPPPAPNPNIQYYNPIPDIPGFTFGEAPPSYLNPPQNDNNFVSSWISTPIPYLIDSSIASIINGGLLPPPVPSQIIPIPSLEPQRTKKIQIIIPYTTIDQSMLSAMQQQQSTFLPDITVNLTTNKLSLESSHTFMPMITEPPQQARKVPFQNFDNFKNVNRTSAVSETQQVTNRTDFKFVDVPSNIKDILMRHEVEARNHRLQKNIDDWTALEFSNHKTTTQRQPTETISQAQSVTSIPGTSISHLLLQSKKIPETYFSTTPAPKYDEPTTTSTPYVSVNSRPFSPSTESIYKVNLENIKQHSQYERFSQLSNYANQQNHKNGYTVVQKIKPNSWSKLNENLIVPEESVTEGNEVTTNNPASWEDIDVSISPITKEKVYVVTPVSRFTTSDDSWSFENKRTTRHIGTTDKNTHRPTDKSLLTISKTSPVRQISSTEKYQKPIFDRNIVSVGRNSTKLFPSRASRPLKEVVVPRPLKEVITPRTPIIGTAKPKQGEKNKTESTHLFKVRPNKIISKFNKPKPIDKFFPTTTTAKPTTSAIPTAISDSSSSSSSSTTSETPLYQTTSINDIFPFRNGGELPVEMARITKSFADVALQMADRIPERKTLIKQTNIKNKKPNYKAPKIVYAETVEVDFGNQTTTTSSSSSGSQPVTEKPKLHFTKRSTAHQSPTTQTPTEANTTTESLSETNATTEQSLTEKNNQTINKTEKDDLLAVESGSKMPKGVFGETTKVEKPKDYKSNFEAIRDTITLLKEFLNDTDKTENDQTLKTKEDFKEHDQLLERLERLKPIMDETKKNKPKTETKHRTIKENLNNLENKLMKKRSKPYLNNFPEYSHEDISLSHEEMDLLEGAMMELKKSKEDKVETNV